MGDLVGPLSGHATRRLSGHYVDTQLRDLVGALSVGTQLRDFVGTQLGVLVGTQLLKYFGFGLVKRLDLRVTTTSSAKSFGILFISCATRDTLSKLPALDTHFVHVALQATTRGWLCPVPRSMGMSLNCCGLLGNLMALQKHPLSASPLDQFTTFVSLLKQPVAQTIEGHSVGLRRAG